MKKIIFTLFIIHFTLLIANAQWVAQQSGVTTPLYNVDFVNSSTGWVTGANSVILKTTNGGINWFQQTIDLGYPKNLYGLDMLDENTGYIAGWFETILKTTNGGINWLILSNIPSNHGNSNNAISFANAQTGWICSFLGRVLWTTNGGIYWDTANVGNTGPLRDIQFLNTRTGWICGDVGDLLRSTNGGINWDSAPLLTTSNLLSLFFLNDKTGWTVSEQQNEVFRTTDGGNKWDTVGIVPYAGNQESYSIYFSSALTGWVGGDQIRLFKTTNGGFNWIQQIVPTPMFVQNFYFCNDSTGWATGGSLGPIIHTTTGGSYVGITPISVEVPSEFELFQNYPNPFNNQTVIEYDISENAHYSITIYDVLGRTVDVIFDKYITAGRYKINYDASNLPSGIYFYRIYGLNKSIVKKFTLIK
jgi:photosystem II stability/assembly factor-like uncharacterized protein